MNALTSLIDTLINSPDPVSLFSAAGCGLLHGHAV